MGVDLEQYRANIGSYNLRINQCKSTEHAYKENNNSIKPKPSKYFLSFIILVTLLLLSLNQEIYKLKEIPATVPSFLYHFFPIEIWIWLLGTHFVQVLM